MPTYRLLISTLRQEPMVNADETGWRVNSRVVWLRVFTSKGLTVYTVDRRRSHQVAERSWARSSGGS